MIPFLQFIKSAKTSDWIDITIFIIGFLILLWIFVVRESEAIAQ